MIVDKGNKFEEKKQQIFTNVKNKSAQCIHVIIWIIIIVKLVYFSWFHFSIELMCEFANIL